MILIFNEFCISVTILDEFLLSNALLLFKSSNFMNRIFSRELKRLSQRFCEIDWYFMSKPSNRHSTYHFYWKDANKAQESMLFLNKKMQSLNYKI
jgi:hypothetical protein